MNLLEVMLLTDFKICVQVGSGIQDYKAQFLIGLYYESSVL